MPALPLPPVLCLPDFPFNLLSVNLNEHKTVLSHFSQPIASFETSGHKGLGVNVAAYTPWMGYHVQSVSLLHYLLFTLNILMTSCVT